MDYIAPSLIFVGIALICVAAAILEIARAIKGKRDNGKTL